MAIKKKNKKVKKTGKKKKLKKSKKRTTSKKKAKKAEKHKKSKKQVKKKKTSKRKPKIRRSKPSRQTLEILPWRKALPGETLLGIVEDYFSHVNVLATTLKTALQVGNRIHVRGHTTDLVASVNSMQIEHQPVENAGSGDSIGVKIDQKVRKGDYIYKIY